jgi:hypothetical protein
MTLTGSDGTALSVPQGPPIDQTQDTPPAPAATEHRSLAPPSSPDSAPQRTTPSSHTGNPTTHTPSLSPAVTTVVNSPEGVPTTTAPTSALTDGDTPSLLTSATHVATPTPTLDGTSTPGTGVLPPVDVAANQGQYLHTTGWYTNIHCAPVPTGSNNDGAPGSRPSFHNRCLERAIADASQKKRKADKLPRTSTKKQKVTSSPGALAIPNRRNSIRYEPPHLFVSR